MYQKPMKFERSDKQPKKIIIENRVTPIKRLIAMLSFPALLVACFYVLNYKEYHSLWPSLDFIFASLFIASPFAIVVSYKMCKRLKTKIILTDEKIIRKPPRGKELHMSWSEIKKIKMGLDEKNNCLYLVFTRAERYVPFDNDNRIYCPPGSFPSKEYLSRDAANLILKKIDLYKILIEGKREHLEEITKKHNPSLQGPATPAAPNMTGEKRLPARPSSSAAPTPK
jgi:hypothetical protein